MEIKRNGSQPSSRGQAEYFTGSVRIDPLHQANDPARAGGADKDVTCVEEPDAAYSTKYRRYAASIISHINGPEAGSATIQLVPLSAGS